MSKTAYKVVNADGVRIAQYLTLNAPPKPESYNGVWNVSEIDQSELVSDVDWFDS